MKTIQKKSEPKKESSRTEKIYGQNSSLKAEKQSPRNNPNRRKKNSGLDINTEG